MQPWALAKELCAGPGQHGDEEVELDDGKSAEPFTEGVAADLGWAANRVRDRMRLPGLAICWGEAG